MKILHIISGELSGGAARGAYWLHKGLIKEGVQSKILTNGLNKNSGSTIHSVVETKKGRANQFLKSRTEQLPVQFYRKRKGQIFSTALFGTEIKNHPLIGWADIVHLHWINSGFIDIKELKEIKKPIIWTLRDMWPFTGGCHYSMHCTAYKSGCGSCFQLGSNSNYDLSRYIVKRKKKYYPKNMHLVGISNWISEKAKESFLFKDFNIHTIPNNIDCVEFFPTDKETAKEILGINTKKKIILAGAQNVKDFYKGFEHFLEALNGLSSDEYYLIFFGNLNTELMEDLPFEYHNFGFIHDTISLRLIYSSADVFVAPSILEAFGKTIAEAMACGTPVVCFNATGPKDIVTHKKDGYKAIPFEAQDLADGIKWIANNPKQIELRTNARIKVEKTFSQPVIAKQYIELYDEVIVKPKESEITFSDK